ncbi:MAG TPA: carboxylesterase family protein [Steroidobacteraceae bacterium]|jgi:triacylglycerol lipase|nr:carboxylesterase family protein [Steroidobacteraceae bacterium]
MTFADSHTQDGLQPTYWPQRPRRHLPLVRRGLTLLALSALTGGAALAAVPPDIEAALIKIGPIVDPPCTAKLYRPLMPANDIGSGVAQPYQGITVARNQSFGPDPLDVVDVFSAEHGPAARTVLIFVPGGAGDKTEIQDREANAFYDNIGRWATQHGMVGVLMQRKASPTWDGGAKDISAMLQWVEAHIGQYHGNPDRMFIWAHSAGNVPLGTYIGRPELYGPKGVGVKGVIFMSGAAFDIAPVKMPPMDMRAMGAIMATTGKQCGMTPGMSAAMSTAGALPGVAPGGPGGPPAAGPGMAGFPRPPDAATQLARSSLPELEHTSVRIMLANGQMDIGVDHSPDAHGLTTFNKALDQALCAAGRSHCPTLLVAKGHSHMSMVFSIDSPDTTVSGPVLAFIHGTR